MPRVLPWCSKPVSGLKRTLKSSRVAVALSGGVDSSVAAYLIKQQGHRVMGIHMQNWDRNDEEGREACPYEQDLEDVKSVCVHLGIEFECVNFSRSYWNDVFTPFVEGYASGLTPNPDVLCNREIKFSHMLHHALHVVKADYLATGHYARVQHPSEERGPQLLRGVDYSKDQSYFLSAVPGDALRNVLFPLGEMKKAEVRALARDVGISTANKKDSYGLCFIGKRANFGEWLSEYVEPTGGPLLDVQGNQLGNHEGFSLYTIGQGAGISGVPIKMFVAGKCLQRNGIVAVPGTDHPALFCDYVQVSADSFNWVAGEPPARLTAGETVHCQFRLRHRQQLEDCEVTLLPALAEHPLVARYHSWTFCECEGCECANLFSNLGAPKHTASHEHERAACGTGSATASALTPSQPQSESEPESEPKIEPESEPAPQAQTQVQALEHVLHVRFKRPQRAVTPEQVVALYHGDVCLVVGIE